MAGIARLCRDFHFGLNATYLMDFSRNINDRSEKKGGTYELDSRAAESN